jgi:4-hydroxy-tetrahydrodipicolinate reductase
MIKIIINGINGKMGKVLSRAVQNAENMELAAGFDICDDGTNPCPVYKTPFDFQGGADVIIDFSHPSLLNDLINYATEKNIAAVIATTGLSEEERLLLKQASEKIPILNSSNMSLGVNLLLDLVNRAAAVLYENYDIEIIEKHHNQKIDAPSGTALMLADEIAKTLDDGINYVYDRHSARKKRDKKEIGIHAVRGGTIVGEHEIIFAGRDEVISISHQAMSKEIFATGSVRAAEFLAGQKPGFYTMKDVVSK